jgi:excisionase family DNA binding protein
LAYGRPDQSDSRPLAGAVEMGSPAKLADDLLRSAEEIGTYLGIPTHTVYYLARTSRLPHVKVGRRIFARKSAIDRAFSCEPAPAQAAE